MHKKFGQTTTFSPFTTIWSALTTQIRNLLELNLKNNCYEIRFKQASHFKFNSFRFEY